LLLGFDHFERLLERAAKSGGDGYPPYNIEQIGEDGLRITLAVAGFRKQDIAITVDMADSQKDSACDTSIQVTGICPEGGLYCLVDRTGIMHPRVFLDHLIELTKTWSPRYVGLEAPAYKNFLIHAAFDEGVRNEVMLPLIALDPGNKSKDARALGLLNHVDRYGIFLRAGMEDLKRDLLDYPLGKKRDRIDALAYRSADILRARTKKVPPKDSGGRVVSIYNRADTLIKMMDDPRYAASVKGGTRRRWISGA